jgi:meso-butanediol dehydrogenase / (S,S)-butanediol dehydrogenase / diacetyl reductase
MTKRLDGKVVLVSGAARGIGAAATTRMAAEGARLVVCDIDGPALADTAQTITSAGGEITTVVGDASDSRFVDSWVQSALARYGRIDVLYNNVGVSRAGLIGDLSDDDWRFQQRMTLDTVFYGTRAVLGPMVEQRSGSIISMSSGAGVAGEYNLGGYAAAKAGVINLMETVASEYGRYNIRANALTPGPTATAPFVAHMATQPGTAERLAAALDLGRLSQPEEVANTILWLASDESSNITGICVRSNIRAPGIRPF